jgi:hypothetical protein
MDANSSRDTRNMEVGNSRQASNSTDASNIRDKTTPRTPGRDPKTQQGSKSMGTLYKSPATAEMPAIAGRK